MFSSSIRLALVAGAALAAAGIVHAGTPVDLSKLGPKQQAHLAQIQAKQRADSPLYNYDIRPAVLKSIHVGGKVNAGQKFAQAVVSLTANDNLTGVHQISVTLASPSGQFAYTTWESSYDVTRNELQIGVDMSNVSENGQWRVYSVSVSDSNGNASYYDEGQLAGMGNTVFTVVGAAGDFIAPAAQTGGVNLTPIVSRSTPPRGMLPGQSARVAVQLNLTDAGVSGIRTATMEFCKDGYYPCFYVSGDVSVRGKTSVALTLGGYVPTYSDLGTYTPYSLYLYDHSGNVSYFYTFNGDDLNSLLDNPVITVNE